LSKRKNKNRNKQYNNQNNNNQSTESYSDQNKSNESTQQEQDTSINFTANFVKSYLSNISQINDPFLQNMIIKNLNMNPSKQTRDALIKLMENPKENEKSLRDFAEYLGNIVMQFRRLVDFFGSILSFDHFIEPTNADEEDMKSKSFKTSYKKATDWIERFNPKKQCPEILKKILRQEAAFYYLRENKDSIFLQEMPVDYCKIISKTEYGYQYAFDLSYFFQMGTNIDHYDPVFKTYLESYQNTNAYKNRTPYWVDLNPIYAPCFKFDETNAGMTPPFMAMFPDSLDISDYRELTKTKGELDLYKIILNKIPVHGGDGKTRKANDLAIDGNMAGTFSKVIENKLPNKTYMKSITTPFDNEVIDFQRSESGNVELDIGNELFSNSSGVNPNIFGADSTSASGIKASLESATSFVWHIYPIFERFINTHLKMNTGKYRWKIHFDGTRYDRQDRMDRAFKAAGSGFPKTFVAMAMGTTLETVNNMTNLENSMSLVDKLKPFVSAHTQSGSDGGRPTSASVGDAGEKTRDTDSNVR
jgi:hypothetical protein